jgi:ribosomal protein S12 methylthiotransferase accessory factor
MFDQLLQGTYQPRSLDDCLEMAEPLVDSSLGIIKSIVDMPQYPGEPSFFQYTALLANIDRIIECPAFSALAGGASIHWREAKMRALGEAIEHYCSFICFEDELIYASYNELGHRALDPMRLPVCSGREHSNPLNYLVKPRRDGKLRWRAAYSVTESQIKFVPANLVYLSHRYSTDDERISLPISTGLACGSNAVEAFQSGLCEVVERDALIITWLHQLPVPRIDMTRIEDEEIKERLTRLDEAGLEPFFFNITTEIQIPSVLLVLMSRHRTVPVLTVTTATHPNPKRAIAKVMDEGVSTRKFCVGKLREGFVPKVNLRNPSEFAQLEDHLFAYIYPRAVSKFDFLLKNSTTIGFDELPDLSTADPVATLKNIMSILDYWNMEVIVADITTRDVKEAGFTVVRVLVPELQPLSQNHNIRYLGTKRLYEVPKRMGYGSKRRNESQITNLPHPFA